MAIFDKMAGHVNNPKKVAVTATALEVRKMLATANVGSEEDIVHPRVFTVETLVGDFVTAKRCPTKSESDERIKYTLEAARRVEYRPAGQARRVKATAHWVIPRMIQGTLWTFPAAKSFRKLRTSILTSTFSTKVP